MRSLFAIMYAVAEHDTLMRCHTQSLQLHEMTSTMSVPEPHYASTTKLAYSAEFLAVTSSRRS